MCLHENLKVVLESSKYWRDRFSEFGLRADHLIAGKFPVGVDYINDLMNMPSQAPVQSAEV